MCSARYVPWITALLCLQGQSEAFQLKVVRPPMTHSRC